MVSPVFIVLASSKMDVNMIIPTTYFYDIGLIILTIFQNVRTIDGMGDTAIGFPKILGLENACAK